MIIKHTCETLSRLFLVQEPEDRPGFHDVQSMSLFRDVDWSTILEEEAPFIPQPDDETDTCYFEARNKLQQWNISILIDE